MNTKAMREQRAKLVADFRAIYDKAEAEKRGLNDDELSAAKAINDEIGKLKAQIDLAEGLDAEERSIVPESQRETRREQPSTPGEPTGAQLGAAVVGYLRHGARDMDREQRQMLITYTQRAQNTLSGQAGGYLVRPDTSLYTSIIEAMKFFGGARNMGARIIPTSTGADLPIPVLDDTSNEGAIVNEEGSHVGGTDIAIGQRIMKAFLYSSKVVKVSLQLLQDADYPIEAELGRLFGTRIGRVQNKHFTNGDGANKPQGFIPAATVGKTTASNSAITFDEILDLIHSVDIAYRARGTFQLHDATALVLRKLKDGENKYLWEPGLQVGAPDRLFGYPVGINNDIPTIAASARVMSFGDHSAYAIRDVRAMQVVRLDELYAETAQVGFLAFARADGGLLDAGTGPIKVMQMTT